MSQDNERLQDVTIAGAHFYQEDIAITSLASVEDISISGHINLDDSQIKTDDSKYPFYDGETVVTPSVSQKNLYTKKKIVMDDITVKPIPYAEVSNIDGGITVTIGD